MFVKGPDVLYCRTMSRVAAGAVEAESAPSITATIGSKPSTNRTSNVTVTAPADSRIVMIRAGVPMAASEDFLN